MSDPDSSHNHNSVVTASGSSSSAGDASTSTSTPVADTTSGASTGQLELQDVLAEMIDFCLKLADSSQGVMSGSVNPVKLRINKFREVFESKRKGPNNMKQMVTTVYSKCGRKLIDLENSAASMHIFMTWFTGQNIALQPRDDPKSVSIPLSIICRECLKLADDNPNDHAALSEVFMLHLLRVLAFATTSDEAEDKIDDHIAYLEGLLGLDPNETPDVTGFLVNIMDKLTSRFGSGSKKFGDDFKRLMKGPMDRKKRKDIESAIFKVADGLLDKIPKDIMTNPENFNPAELMTSTMTNMATLKDSQEMKSMFESLGALDLTAMAGVAEAGESSSRA